MADVPNDLKADLVKLVTRKYSRKAALGCYHHAVRLSHSDQECGAGAGIPAEDNRAG